MESTALQTQNQQLSLTATGGQVLTWKVLNPKTNTWQDILYNKGNPKRAGIPILFPFANPLKDNIFKLSGKEIGQHGFGRNSEWLLDVEESTATLILSSKTLDQVWKEAYPFDFEAKIIVDISTPNQLKYTLQVKNLDPEKPLPISPGIHPYFSLLNEQKKLIKSNLIPDIQSVINWDKPSNGNFWNFPSKASFDLKNFKLDIYNDKLNPAKNLVIWSQTEDEVDHDFVCLEPFCKDTNAINDDPIWVSGEWQATWRFVVEF
jgi:galactose mutarotase-like enzyme